MKGPLSRSQSVDNYVKQKMTRLQAMSALKVSYADLKSTIKLFQKKN